MPRRLHLILIAAMFSLLTACGEQQPPAAQKAQPSAEEVAKAKAAADAAAAKEKEALAAAMDAYVFG